MRDYRYFKNYSEPGRSMVEMLGVLAIIGVLSIGGVMGYSYAMDKSRANRVLNDIRLRAVTLQTQNAMGRNLDLSEYNGMSTVYPITVATGVDGYGLNVTGVPQRVCEMIYAGTQGWATVKIGGEDAASADSCEDMNNMVFAFNPDREVNGENEGGNNSDNSENDGNNETNPDNQDDIVCGEGYFLLEGMCYSCPTNTEGLDYCDNRGIKCDNGYYFYTGHCTKRMDWATCSAGQTECGLNRCCEAGQICDAGGDSLDGHCYTPQCNSDADCSSYQLCDTDTKQCVSRGGCSTNSDCDEDRFCDLDVSSTNNSCAIKPKTGSCLPIGTVTNGSGAYSNFIKGDQDLNWWSAENWCKANNKSMASLSDLGITGGYNNGYCQGSECQWADWSALQNGLDNSWNNLWTNRLNDYGRAFSVLPGGSGVSSGPRYDNIASPLCK